MPRKPIAEKWEMYCNTAGPFCCDIHKNVERDAFYAGHAALMATLYGPEADKLSDEEGQQLMNDIRAEIREHISEFLMRVESSSRRIH